MALTVTEANAVNTLLDYLFFKDRAHFPRPGQYPAPPPKVRAIEAAQLLTDHANRTLHAGIRPEQVQGAWRRAKL